MSTQVWVLKLPLMSYCYVRVERYTLLRETPHTWVLDLHGGEIRVRKTDLHVVVFNSEAEALASRRQFIQGRLNQLASQVERWLEELDRAPGDHDMSAPLPKIDKLIL